MRTLMECIIWTLLVGIMILASTVHADPHKLRVGIIDTGLDLNDPRFANLICDSGSMDFTGTGITDHHGHGTHVAGLIKENAKDANYCLVILKYYEKAGQEEYHDDAIKEAVAQKLDIVNMSFTGPTFDEKEKNLICNNPKTKFIVAAGNEGQDLAKTPRYPASYNCKNEIIVGATGKQFDLKNPLMFDGKPKASFSNYGDIVDVWEDGEGIYSTYLNNQTVSLSGTSQATATITGKAIYLLDKYYAQGH